MPQATFPAVQKAAKTRNHPSQALTAIHKIEVKRKTVVTLFVGGRSSNESHHLSGEPIFQRPQVELSSPLNSFMRKLFVKVFDNAQSHVMQK